MEAINRGTAVVRGNTSCWFFIRSQYFGSLVQPCSIYGGILFGLSMLVRIVRPRSMYVSMFFWSLSTAIFYGVCWYFIPPQSRQYPQYGHVLCMLVFYSALVMLVRPVWPCSMFSVLFGLSTLVRLVQPCSTFVAILFRLIITLISQYYGYGQEFWMLQKNQLGIQL